MGKAAVQSLALRGIDFIDLGASDGKSLTWAARTFGGRGLGIDLSADKIKVAESRGHRMIQADARNVQLPANSVSYCLLMDFLEHLPSLEDAEAVVDSAVRLARDFVLIVLPNFDHEKSLRKLGLKRYYADWSVHKLHLLSTQLKTILDGQSGENAVYCYGEILDTFDRSIIPLDAPRNSVFYDPATFGPRTFSILPRRKFFTRTLGIVCKSGEHQMNDVLAKAITGFGYLHGVHN